MHARAISRRDHSEDHHGRRRFRHPDLTAGITASYLGNANHVKVEEIPQIIRAVRSALAESDAPAAESAPETPKMTRRQIAKSITPDGLRSFINGKSYKTLKRHLGRHGHDRKSYREAYGLPADYPSVAPNYSAAGSEMAKKLGLGAQRKGKAQAAAPSAPASRGRKKAEAATAE